MVTGTDISRRKLRESFIGVHKKMATKRQTMKVRVRLSLKNVRIGFKAIVFNKCSAKVRFFLEWAKLGDRSWGGGDRR